jgi:hypothetical protein
MSVYEMRTYYAAPGKLDALIARFVNHTEALFRRHGIKTLGYWAPIENPKEILFYIVEHESFESAEKNWDEFRADKDWQRIRAETDNPVPLAASIERSFMAKIDFPAFKTAFETGVSSKA